MTAPPNSRPRQCIDIVGVPLDHGAGRRGVGMGPAAMRIAGLHAALQRLGYQVRDHGDLEIAAPETLAQGEANAKFLPLIADVCGRLCAEVEGILEQRRFPLVLGGDHSIAIGTVSGLAAHLRKLAAAARKPSADQASEAQPQLAIVWFDAHGDINTPATSPSGNIHGMPVSCLLGDGPPPLTDIGFPGAKFPPARFCQIGVRDIDDTERRLLRASGIHVYTMTEIDKRTMARVMEEVIHITEGADMLHVSFDIDSVDPRVAPGTGTPKLGGLTYREAHLAMEMLAETGRITSLEMVEVNPALDDKNKTAELAVGLIGSALGLRIL